MPVHNWTRVSAGTFHHFHSLWIPEISNALNHGILPPDHYAMAEQAAGDVDPDVLALRIGGSNGEPSSTEPQGTTAVATMPPHVRFTAAYETDLYALKQRHLVIRHASDDRIIALVEILSPGNKSCLRDFRVFLEKAVAALAQGYHLLLIDLQPPTSRDPNGIHGALWTEIAEDNYVAPPDKPLTLVAYTAGRPKRAYIEPIAVGDSLPDMPLFLTSCAYVNVPLEATYQAAWSGVPQRWQRVLENKDD
jgi:hypothetical protein